MIITTDGYMIRSRNVNIYYWEQGVYPDWTALNTLQHFSEGLPGTGVEPHYHDNDEIWLFTDGRGEVWLDGVRHDITPNTLVYTPMGVVHRFQMFTRYENNAIVTRLERAQRATHILVDEDGPPEPTVPGFVIPGAQNNVPIAQPGPRCPLSEWRKLTLTPGEVIPEAKLETNEHWQVLNGTLLLTLDKREITLAAHDVALLRAGIVRSLRSHEGARVTVVRER